MKVFSSLLTKEMTVEWPFSSDIVSIGPGSFGSFSGSYTGIVYPNMRKMEPIFSSSFILGPACLGGQSLKLIVWMSFLVLSI